MVDILLIEDNQDDAFLVDLAIKKCKINGKLLVVNNGKDAIELLNTLVSKCTKLPDLILLDINLPKKTGLEVLQEIKTKQSTKSIPTVIFTSSDSMSDVKYSYDNGADLYVRKPNNINDLKKIIEYIKFNYLLTYL